MMYISQYQPKDKNSHFPDDILSNEEVNEQSCCVYNCGHQGSGSDCGIQSVCKGV